MIPTGWLNTTTFTSSYCLKSETAKSKGVNPFEAASPGTRVLNDSFLATNPSFSKAMM